jgi:deoxyribodipyrimidine photolyase-related protein
LRMEYFYRQMRRKYSILMNQGEPIGGQWNYDAENRKPPASGLDVPDTFRMQPDEITQEVLTLVATHFPDHFGDLLPFHFAVTRDHAFAALEKFIAERLNLGSTSIAGCLPRLSVSSLPKQLITKALHRLMQLRDSLGKS